MTNEPLRLNKIIDYISRHDVYAISINEAQAESLQSEMATSYKFDVVKFETIAGRKVYIDERQREPVIFLVVLPFSSLD